MRQGMNPPEPHKQRYARATAPVNLRTAARERQPTLPVNPAARRSLRQRMARSHAQHLLGQPLREQLAPRAAHTRTPPSTIMLALGLTLSGMGLLTAWWQASAAIASGAAALGLGTAGLTALWRRRALVTGPGHGSTRGTAPAFDPQAIAALDEVLARLGPLVPPPVLEQLTGLKKTLVRIAPLLASTGVNELFTRDDRFYVSELVRRYLPDTLTAFLQVPAAQRGTQGADGRTALQLLEEQLSLLQTELSRREALLVQVAGEALQQQHRFLQAKHRRD